VRDELTRDVRGPVENAFGEREHGGQIMQLALTARGERRLEGTMT